MGAPEKKIINKILSELPDNKRLFRINAGRGWQGTVIKHTGTELILKNPRPFYGAPDGWPDLAGWETIEITPEMVGTKIAVFTGEEIKTGRQKLRDTQKSLGGIILKMGGIFRVIRE